MCLHSAKTEFTAHWRGVIPKMCHRIISVMCSNTTQERQRPRRYFRGSLRRRPGRTGETNSLRQKITSYHALLGMCTQCPASNSFLCSGLFQFNCYVIFRFLYG